MRLFSVLGILFYTVILILIGVTLIIFALHLVQPQDIHVVLLALQYSLQARVIVGLSGLLLILITFSFAQLILGRFQREKTIAFTTSSTLNGLPLTLFNPWASIRYFARTKSLNWPMFHSGIKTLSKFSKTSPRLAGNGFR